MKDNTKNENTSIGQWFRRTYKNIPRKSESVAPIDKIVSVVKQKQSEGRGMVVGIESAIELKYILACELAKTLGYEVKEPFFTCETEEFFKTVQNGINEKECYIVNSTGINYSRMAMHGETFAFCKIVEMLQRNDNMFIILIPDFSFLDAKMLSMLDVGISLGGYRKDYLNAFADYVGIIPKVPTTEEEFEEGTKHHMFEGIYYPASLTFMDWLEQVRKKKERALDKAIDRMKEKVK
ncbi:hypothetical protein AKJ51_01530 [candidate division MSBL1 archaeon SCGC-AAA382A20]|uniref:Uncharacterized protein n=1 Tax=candidate division MSBL1 archaeon SCGC-AAA382A20 TaxID=1698280 RepID=A0A133VLL1_9EURY|nr:hypothetical protein AKJ51_01530 [candidate division MSBL1 archaeon SCGC-AAA382A20]